MAAMLLLARHGRTAWHDQNNAPLVVQAPADEELASDSIRRHGVDTALEDRRTDARAST